MFDLEKPLIAKFNAQNVYTGYNLQSELTNDCSHDTDSFWKKIGKVGIGQAQKRRIPMVVVLENGSVSRSLVVLWSSLRNGSVTFLHSLSS